MAKSLKLRILSFLVFATFQEFLIVVNSLNGFILNMRENTIHQSKTLSVITGVTKVSECLERCLQNCLCNSFDMCNGNICKLRRSSSGLNPSRLKSFKDCRHFEFEQENREQCDRSCMSTVNCCLTSNPCKNGGTCLPPKKGTKRFHCACPFHFRGVVCEKCEWGYTGSDCKTLIRSCRGYHTPTHVRKPGKFSIFDADDIRFKIYCHFEVDSAWTLIQSYSQENINKFRKSFLHDVEQNGGLHSWVNYRLKKSTIESIQNNSSKWRVTCDFEKDRSSLLRDYVRVSKEDVDILTLNESKCAQVEYINVRGYNCSRCTAYIRQANNYSLHFDSFNSEKQNCDFQPSERAMCDEEAGEHNFGWFICTNKDHLCSALPNSTTQTWLGD